MPRPLGTLPMLVPHPRAPRQACDSRLLPSQPRPERANKEGVSISRGRMWRWQQIPQPGPAQDGAPQLLGDPTPQPGSLPRCGWSLTPAGGTRAGGGQSLELSRVAVVESSLRTCFSGVLYIDVFSQQPHGSATILTSIFQQNPEDQRTQVACLRSHSQ